MFWHAGPTTSNVKWTWRVMFAYSATEETSFRYNVLNIEYFFDYPLAFDWFPNFSWLVVSAALIRSSDTCDEVYFLVLLLLAPLLLSWFDFCRDLLAFKRFRSNCASTPLHWNWRLAALIVLCDDYSHSSVCLLLLFISSCRGTSTEIEISWLASLSADFNSP